MHPAVSYDILEPTQEGAVEVIETIQRDQGYRIVATGHQSTVMSERISELERDNTRLRGTTMPNTRSGAAMKREVVNELIDRRVAEALETRDIARNLEPLVEGGGEQEDKNGDDYEGGNGGGNDNGNGNGNRGGNGYNFGGFMLVAQECTYQDFLKCQPLNFNETEGVVGLTRWFEKMETNSHKRAIGIEAAYAMKWTELIKLMIEVYCPRNEIQKMEAENVIVAESTRLQDTIRVANNLIDQKLKGYARNTENKRRFDSNPRDNHGQQPTFKQQNVGGQNVARAYTAKNNKREGYVGSLPYYNKCKLHHAGPCTVKCGNCKRVGHMDRDCTTVVAPNTQRASVGNQPGVVCYECGRPRHFRKDCPKLRNQNHRNKTGSNEATTRAYAIGGGGANPFLQRHHGALLDVAPSTLDTSYAIELTDGIISETNVILRGCMLGLLGHPFDIDLIPAKLGSFDVIIGMDWLAKYHVVIVCDEKIVCIPYGDKVLIIQGDDCDSRNKSKLIIISCTKTHKYMQKGCQVYLAQVTSKKTEDKSEEKRLEDVPIVREFP
ncbi:putative reverse transcriptase domain-containing protein [Tanacetum coccineum]|uniref:Reverse transcriptase domain-containing protein n=1 Tax=Tanacetum coccineum TaxID=301880 RepID=A0ABQ5BHL4_9ASTR